MNEKKMSENQLYLRAYEVCEMCGITKSTLQRWEQKPDFPKKMKVSSRCVLWKKQEIQDYLEEVRV